MAKEKPTSFRFTSETLRKLKVMEASENEKKKKGLRSKKIVDIVEDAIDLYYIHMMDNEAGNEYINHIALAVDNQLKQHFEIYDHILNALLYDSNFNKEAILTVLKTMPGSRTKNDAEVLVQQKKSIFQSIIEEKIQNELSLKKSSNEEV